MKPKILIIDDDNLVCLSLQKVLIKLEYNVDICMEADKAFEKIDFFEPDIIRLIETTTWN